MVERYLESAVASVEGDNEKLSSKIKKLKGAVKLPKTFDYKKETKKTVHQKFK